MAGVSVSPIVPSKSKRMDILSKAFAFSMTSRRCLDTYLPEIFAFDGRTQTAGKEISQLATGKCGGGDEARLEAP